MTWMFIISTTVWVNGWDTSSVASRARSELTSSQCNWKGNRKGKGTDETPHSNALQQNCVSLLDRCTAMFLIVKTSQFSCKKNSGTIFAIVNCLL